MTRGKYIVIEGGEFSGKSTQLQLLRAYMEQQGIGAVFTREPGGSPFGDILRHTLFHPPEELSDAVALHLFTANRLHNYETIIRPALQSGVHVISDRNWYSTLCYQAARGELSPSFIESLTKTALPEEYVEPDIAFILTIDPDTRQGRREQTPLQDGAIDTFERRTEAYHSRVTDYYRELAEQKQQAILIDGRFPARSIHETIIHRVKKLLEQQD